VGSNYKFYFDGCSMTYGGGLGKYGYNPLDVRWSKLISDHYDAEEHNFSKGGAANETILRNFFVENFDELHTYDAFFIQSTYPSRGEYFDDIDGIWKRYKFVSNGEEKTRLSKENPQLLNWIQYYLTRIFSEKGGEVKEKVMYRSIDSYIKLLNKPVFWSTNMQIDGRYRHVLPSVATMKYDFYFNSDTTYDRLPDKHPSPEGHKEITKIMIDIMDKKLL